ncbi:reverse transcriptase domain-containing protein [Thermobacillus composti]|uniref:reverse transcriptase domain-containing protein n=1 Tax=Thermobacillus composti TaxID=377615 RepID=UPI00069CA3DD
MRDRLVQMAAKIVLESIFEADFQDVSYGFRPKRSAHDALRKIMDTVNNGQVYWVVDVDIMGYFDNISHEKLMKLVEMRVSDRKMLKLIRGWLKAGVMKDDQFHESEIGSPQGGVISPLLANIYLNCLDTIRARRFAHLGTLVRYADDLVRGGQPISGEDRLVPHQEAHDLLPEEVQEVVAETIPLLRDPEGSQTAVRYHVAKYVLRKVKNVGKPYEGKPLVRFDEEGLVPQPFTLHRRASADRYRAGACQTEEMALLWRGRHGDS